MESGFCYDIDVIPKPGLTGQRLVPRLVNCCNQWTCTYHNFGMGRALPLDMKTNTATQARLETEILDLVSEQPRRLDAVFSALRRSDIGGVRWTDLTIADVAAVLHAYGVHFGTRTHGAGRVVYVATVPFSS